MKKAGLFSLLLVAVPLLAACDLFVSADTRLQRSDKAIADNDYGRAVVELRNVAQKQPDNLQVRTKLVEALLLSSDLTPLDNEVPQLVAKGERSPEVQVLLARIYVAKRDFNGLLTALDNRKLQLDGSAERLYRAQALLGLQRNSEARALLEQLSSERPNDAEVQLTYAKSLAAAGNVEQSLKTLNALLAANTKDARALAAKGYLLAMQGRSLDAAGALISANRNAGGQLTRAEELTLLALLVEQQLRNGNTKAAELTLKQLSGFFPNSPVAALAAGEVNFAAANYGEVVPQMQKLLTAQPELQAARLLLGRALAAQGNQRQAETELQRVVSAMPQHGLARMALAQVQLKLGENRQALTTLAPISGDQQAAALFAQAQAAVATSAKDLSEFVADAKRESGNEPLRVVAAGTLLRAGQPAAALELLRDTRQAQFSPQRVPVLLRALSMQGNAADARSEADRIGAQYAREPAYLVAIATFFSGEKNYAAARGWYERALTALRAPQTNNAAAGTGELALVRELIALDLAEGNKPGALLRAQNYREQHPQSGEAMLLQADLQMQLQDLTAAVANYQALFDRSPSGGLAMKLAKAKQLAGSAQPFTVLTHWLVQYPDDVGVRAALADGYLANNQLHEAAGEYEKVIDAQPANFIALNNLAFVYQTQGDSRAEGVARKAYALAPASPVVGDTLGWILVKSGKADEGFGMLADAAAKMPRSPEVQYHYAEALKATGKQQEARERLTALLTQYPQFQGRSQAEQALTALNSAAH